LDIATSIKPTSERILDRKDTRPVNKPIIPPRRAKPHRFFCKAVNPPTSGNNENIIPSVAHVFRINRICSIVIFNPCSCKVCITVVSIAWTPRRNKAHVSIDNTPATISRTPAITGLLEGDPEGVSIAVVVGVDELLGVVDGFLSKGKDSMVESGEEGSILFFSSSIYYLPHLSPYYFLIERMVLVS